MTRALRAIALVDGEHHPAVVRDALERLATRHEIAAVVFCGGEEKVAGDLFDPAVTAEERARRQRVSYGHAMIADDDAAGALVAALDRVDAEIVCDLADEPLVDAGVKLKLASLALDRGLSYEGPGLLLTPQRYRRIASRGAQIAIIGTGKRTGKTALCGYLADLLKRRGIQPVIVSMGRGGPATPEFAEPGTGLAQLLEIARRGDHAASDYLEDAVIAGVPSIGCRRAGGGIAGEVVETNLIAGAKLAAERDPDCILFEGSGATIPAVTVDATICVVGDAAGALSHLGPMRLLRADLVVVMNGDRALAREASRWTSGRVVSAELTPEPLRPIVEGRRIACFTTGAIAPAGIDIALCSSNLARRVALAEDLDRAEQLGCDVFLTELKAAAIELVAERAERIGAEIVFLRNRPTLVDGLGAGDDLDAILCDLYDTAVDRHRSPASTVTL